MNGPTRTRALVGVWVLAIAVALIVARSAQTTAAQAQTPRPASQATLARDFVLPPVPDGHPCLNAVATPAQTLLQDRLSASQSSKPPSFALPNDKLAADSSLKGSWRCGDMAVYTYPHVTVSIEPGWNVPDGTDLMNAYVTHWHTGTVETINGWPAFVSGVAQWTPTAEVLSMRNGTMVRVVGDGSVQASDLVDVLTSMN